MQAQQNAAELEAQAVGPTVQRTSSPSPAIAPVEGQAASQVVQWVPPDQPPEGCDISEETYAALKIWVQQPERMPKQDKSDAALKAAGYSGWAHYMWYMLCMNLD